MSYAWTGVNLEVDLSQGKAEKQEITREFNEEYVGGRGANAKVFWERVPPEVEPLSPENLLIFRAGALVGTSAPSANRTTITTKSPQVNLQTFSTLGGFWGVELKHAGYDSVVISGKAPGPVYLWINDGSVEIRDANHLQGKDTNEAQRLIQEELGNDRVQIVCIGPAGENMVNFASIEHGLGDSASRTGVGTVMGDKNLKAIAVYGTKDVNVARPAEFAEVCEQVRTRSDGLREFYEKWNEFFIEGMLDGGVYSNQRRLIELGNSVGDIYGDFTAKYRGRQAACYNCAVKCKELVSVPEAGYFAAKCQAQSIFILSTGVIDIPFSVKCSELCHRYGLDQVTTANAIAFAIELYQKGILTREDTGMPLEEGNAEAAFWLIDKMARRDGIGDILANGVHEAARIIGKGAEEAALCVKKLEQSPYAHSMPYVALNSAVSDREDYTKSESLIPQGYFHHYQEYANKHQYNTGDPRDYPWPSGFEKFFTEPMDWAGADIERTSQLVHFDMCNVTLADMAGVCRYWAGFWAAIPANYRRVIDLLSYATGVDYDEDRIFKTIKKASALLRAYNVRLGIRRKDDTVPDRFFRVSPGAPYQPLDPGRFSRMIDRFYELRGWNNEGIPGRETLDELGLDFVREDLEQRGIL
ncbi:MAG: aldehyde dehydrogenase [Chloroflexi bacterium]|nr:aldehyde dehydrogenase [Chloroflexota bacterium]